MGLKICEPEIVAEMKDCLVVIGTNSYVTEIKEQLLDMGIEDERIFVPEKEWWLGSDIQYFDRNIMRAHRNESFIDGGALGWRRQHELYKMVQWRL